MRRTANPQPDEQREIWVLGERQGDQWPQVTLELLQDAHSLAKKSGWSVIAVIFAQPDTVQDHAGQELAAHGADEVIVLENEQFCQPISPLLYSEPVKDLIGNRPIQVLLCPSTPLWIQSVTPIINHLKGYMASNVISFRASANTELEITRYAWNNKVQITLTCPSDRPCAIALRPNVAGVGRPTPGRKAKLSRNYIQLRANPQVEFLELIPPDPREIDLLEAERIVAGGRGMGNAEGFSLLQKLAALLEAGVGATRVAVDLGWVPYSRQIGQTGKTVKPRLYIAIGISGASQHVDGMRESEVIIAINTDPKAAIFQLADLSVVGDSQEIVTALINRLKDEEETAIEHQVSAGT